MNFWNRISNLGSHPEIDSENQRRLKLLCRINFVVIIMLLSYSVVHLSLGMYAFAVVLYSNVLLLTVVLFLIYKNRLVFVKYMTLFSLTCMLSFFVLTGSSNSMSEVLLIPIVALPLAIMKNKKEAIVLLFVFIALVLSLKLLHPYSYYLGTKTTKVSSVMSLINCSLAMVVTFLITYYFRIAGEDYQSELKKASLIIGERNKELDESLKYAKRIQQAIIPNQERLQEILPDSFVLYLPKDVIAGDFYWIESVGELTLLAAADCTGHGVPGAMVSVICNNCLNRSVRIDNLDSPGKILDKTRELIIAEFANNDLGVKDGMDISLIGLQGNILQWAGANNPLWIISDGVLTEISADRQPVGSYSNLKAFTTHIIELEKDDMIYLLTDGYQDQFGGEKGKKLKAANLKSLLMNIRNESMSRQKEILNARFEEWKGDLEQIDDVCIIGVRIS